MNRQGTVPDAVTWSIGDEASPKRKTRSSRQGGCNTVSIYLLFCPMNGKIFFDVAVLYYLPQFLPVFRELERRGANCTFIIYSDPINEGLLSTIIAGENLPAVVVGSADDAAKMYRDEKPEWVVFGNSCKFIQELREANIRTALLYHGIGIKDCYYDANLLDMDIRFVEGEFRRREILRRYPDAALVATGFAKLDPLFSDSPPAFDLAAINLDPARKTLLYAPTYYPSSIELMPDDFPRQAGTCNIIVKPHFFTFAGKKYAGQLKKINHWKGFPNVYVAPPEEYSLLPFLAIADVLISEASSAIFEFAALDKPVVWLDFLKLRWTYRGFLRFRHDKRMDKTILQYADIACHVAKPADLPAALRQELEKPETRSATRKLHTEELIGKTDGKASKRIADYLLGASS